MSARLLPWAACAALVLALAVRAALPGKGGAVPAPAGARGAGETGPEIRLGPAEVREFHDDDTSNRLSADGAVYEYARKTLSSRGTVVYLMGGALRGSIVRAPSASWDFDRAMVSLPEGGRMENEGGWGGELSPAIVDLAGRLLRVPGAATVTGPGFSVTGQNLAWNWREGKITMDSPRGLIRPAAALRRGG